MIAHLALLCLFIWTNIANLLDSDKQRRMIRKRRFYNAEMYFAITGRFQW